jgi:hypothetical protein
MNRWMFVLVAAFGMPACGADEVEPYRPRPSDQYSDVEKVDGVYLAIGDRYGEQPIDDVALVARSTDGASWQVTEHPELGGLGTLVHGNGRWVAATSGQLHWSDDGVVWNAAEGAVGYPWGLTFGGGVFVAGFLGGGDAALATSADGAAWTAAITPPPYLSDPKPVFVIDRFVVEGGDAEGSEHIYESLDGQTWTEAEDASKRPAVYGPGAGAEPRVIAIGTSVDLEAPPTNWGSYLDDDDAWRSFDVPNVGVNAFACGDVACVARSEDGLIRNVGHPLDWSWQLAQVELDRTTAMIADGAELVAVGATIVRSVDDGVTWTTVVE